jgi:low affinity Fe/Cu permease
VKHGSRLEKLSHKVVLYSGSSWAFIVALSAVIVWAVSGPFFNFSNTWQLAVNTGTTVITFLMVFLIQRSQNKEMQAVHLKLNELVAALEGASSRLVDIEDLSEEELKTLHQHYQKLAQIAKKDIDLRQSHSIEEAEKRFKGKVRKAS